MQSQGCFGRNHSALPAFVGALEEQRCTRTAANEECKPCVSKGETRWRPVLFLGIHYVPACPEKGDKEDMCKTFAVLFTFKVVNQ